MRRNFEIDPTIANLLPKLTGEEREGLDTQIRSRKHVDALVVLVLKDSGRRILGDGHNRLEIADRLSLPFATRDVHVDDMSAAIEWVVAHQLGRRNVTAEMRSYLRGKEYLSQKRPAGNPQLVQNAPIGESAEKQGKTAAGSTAEKLAEKHGVSPDTIKRDAEFAEGVDSLPDKAKAKVLKGEATATKPEVASSIFCRPCRVGGPKKNCKECAELRGEKKPAPKPRPPKQGREKFDWRAFDGPLGKVIRGPDELARAYGDKGTEFDECHKHLIAFVKVWKAWQKRLCKT